MNPLKLTIAAVSVGHDDNGQHIGVATLTGDLDTIRAVGGMLMREVVVVAGDGELTRAYDAVCVDLVTAEARAERLQRLTAWTSLPEIPEHYETVEVKLCDDSRVFAWRDDDGGWHAEGRPGITDADVVGWRSIIP